MTKLLLMLILIISILSVNLIAFFYYRITKNIYFSAFIILISAGVLAIVEGFFAMIILDDAFGFFFGLNLVGPYLLINSIIVLLIAVAVSIIKFSKLL
ncbi:3-isopropylmalate dehydrogenase [Neobacillus rhizophilus]|uniref:3-isopropylmalate dehydrogenase n=1 Tax=Neobacillus rhizophilus TaxID=2833579 RepID=A0A942U3M8_9BACI|nr:3-isopropylmalate dehydrogenase [Neobacillus rhizophilus]MBS4214045.1 3-isopropylmalate dehydrogenase [Neobacillus rhizophilus]MBU8917552.1 3-isopropylmalate dehydrogenase [Bacillus sp. FJAT-29953]